MFPPTTHTQNTNTTHPPSSRTHHFCYWTIYANPGSVFPVLSSSKPVSSVKLWPWVFPFFPDWEICHPKFFLSIFSSFSWQHFFISINFLYKPDTSLLSDPEKNPQDQRKFSNALLTDFNMATSLSQVPINTPSVCVSLREFDLQSIQCKGSVGSEVNIYKNKAFSNKGQYWEHSRWGVS